MKISAARIRNFKLLRKIDINFSVDPQKPLTIIRAENGSGKTSTLQAFRWAFHGNNVLEEPGVRLSPANWPDGKPCEISIEIDFIHTATSEVGNKRMESKQHYMLKRQVIERPAGDEPNKEKERMTLYERTDIGDKPVDKSIGDHLISTIFPEKMSDIFFTDGDVAMTFISRRFSKDVRQNKVKSAIRLLLGVDLLDQVDACIQKHRVRIHREIKSNTSSEKLKKITGEIEKCTEEKNDSEKNVATLNEKIENMEKERIDFEKELTQILEEGSYEQLARQHDTSKELLGEYKDEENRLQRSHQELFQDETLSQGLLELKLKQGFDYLDSLHAKGTIPRATVPILKERLELKKCICGADLSDGTMERENVTKLIQKHRLDDDKIEHLSSLYYQTKSEMEKQASQDTKKWLDLYTNIVEQRLSIDKKIENTGKELKSVEAKLDKIDEKEIQQKRTHVKMLTDALEQCKKELYKEKGKIEGIKPHLKELDKEQKKLRDKDEKIFNLDRQITAIDDLKYVVSSTLEEMTGDCLKTVSDRMNKLFLGMIGTEREQEDAVFQGVEINDEYNILVKTKDNRTLSPDYEVNGASQRALTFAFIWALTEVSEVVAPRIIDTPLGMMSGSVKRRVLEMISKVTDEDIDRQVILFLTQSEISHTEDILDDSSGKTCTLIKTDDYPTDLINDPKAMQSEVRLCGCSHRQYCVHCERKNHADFKLSYRTS